MAARYPPNNHRVDYVNEHARFFEEFFDVSSRTYFVIKFVEFLKRKRLLLNLVVLSSNKTTK